MELQDTDSPAPLLLEMDSPAPPAAPGEQQNSSEEATSSRTARLLKITTLGEIDRSGVLHVNSETCALAAPFTRAEVTGHGDSTRAMWGWGARHHRRRGGSQRGKMTGNGDTLGLAQQT